MKLDADNKARIAFALVLLLAAGALRPFYAVALLKR